MIIDSSNVQLDATHSYNREREVQELLHLFTQNGQQTLNADGLPADQFGSTTLVESLDDPNAPTSALNSTNITNPDNPAQALAGTGFADFGQRLQTAMDGARAAGENLGLPAGGNMIPLASNGVISGAPGTPGLGSDPLGMMGSSSLGGLDALSGVAGLNNVGDIRQIIDNIGNNTGAIDPLGLIAGTAAADDTTATDPSEDPEVIAAQQKHDQIMALIDALVESIMKRVNDALISKDGETNKEKSLISDVFNEQSGEGGSALSEILSQMNPGAEIGANVANGMFTRIGVQYERTEIIRETESTHFSSNGVVKTADGKEIRFDLDLAMDRELVEMNHEKFNMDMLIDPLVLNYDGNAADLTAQTFNFDLNADGVQENIHAVSPGSGILVFDKNADGIANDGSELFGPTTGQGFAELAAHDADGNDWIDAGDSIFDDLKLWSKDAEGNDQYMSLSDAGVGAIYTGSVATPFTLRDQGEEAKGVIARSGVYLKENGEAGTAQELHLNA